MQEIPADQWSSGCAVFRTMTPYVSDVVMGIYNTHLKRGASVQEIVLVRAEFRIANIRLERLKVRLQFVVAHDTISCAQLGLNGKSLFCQISNSELPQGAESSSRKL